MTLVASIPKNSRSEIRVEVTLDAIGRALVDLRVFRENGLGDHNFSHGFRVDAAVAVKLAEALLIAAATIGGR